MMSSNKYSPVLILGMHRSGTSMICRMLRQLGLFMGQKRDHNEEALFFQNLNNWLLRQCGASWDNPRALRFLLDHGKARQLAVDYIRYILDTPHVISYMGWSNYLKYRFPENLKQSWGWKDPRNTFTLSIWLEIFPDARVVHIYRNGVDVANSLKLREERRFNNRSQYIHQKQRLIYLFRPKRGGFTDSLRCSSLEGGFSLWMEYLTQARTQVKQMKDRSIEIRFEDFVAQPKPVLESLVSFCGLSSNKNEIDEICSQIKKTRAFAYKREPELGKFAQQVRKRMQLLGYKTEYRVNPE